MATPWAATRAVNGCIFTRFSSLWMARALPHGALRPHPQAARLLRPPPRGRPAALEDKPDHGGGQDHRHGDQQPDGQGGEGQIKLGVYVVVHRGVVFEYAGILHRAGSRTGRGGL